MAATRGRSRRRRRDGFVLKLLLPIAFLVVLGELVERCGAARLECRGGFVSAHCLLGACSLDRAAVRDGERPANGVALLCAIPGRGLPQLQQHFPGDFPGVRAVPQQPGRQAENRAGDGICL